MLGGILCNAIVFVKQMLLEARVGAKHPQHGREFSKFAQGILHLRRLWITEEIHVEKIIPGGAHQGTRFDLGQMQVAAAKYTNGLIEAA